MEALRRAADHSDNGAGSQRCIVCGHLRESWVGYCEACDHWDTYRPVAETAAQR